MSHVKDRDHRELFVLLGDIHLEESDRKISEHVQRNDSFLRDIRLVFLKNEMARFAIRQSYVQFSMTIFFHLS